ncbi:MAG: TraB/GumN family protein, partial [Algicola sp.]|nr:TraB/GumN family protein [Algicola sp.]
VKRNVEMVDKLMVLLKAGKRVFLVVGTAHLVGPENMLDLLRKQGVVVTKHVRAGKQHHPDNIE